MSYIKDILKEELDRLEALRVKYESSISSLPGGTISIKKRNKKEYLYLAHREGKKVKFKYIGTIESDIAKDVMHNIKQRKQFEEKLKAVIKDLKEIEKAIHGKKI